MGKPAQFLRSQLRRIGVFAATITAAAVLGLMGLWWWPAVPLALGLLFVLERQAGEGRVLDPEHLRKGILGEEAVADVLAGLPSSYWVLHSVSTGHGDVDHVVIGPTGVFALETKAWEGAFYRSRGRLFCNGKPAEHVLRQAREPRRRSISSSWMPASTCGRGRRGRRARLRVALPDALPEGLPRLDRGRHGPRHAPAPLAQQLGRPAGRGKPGAAGRGGPRRRPTTRSLNAGRAGSYFPKKVS